MLFLLKLILLVLVLKAVWIIGAMILFALFWGAVIAIIAGRSLRDRLNARPTDFRLPR